SPHPADAPKYLDAIIEAYQGYLRTVYEEASISKLLGLDTAITQAKNKATTLNTEKLRKERERDQVSQEQLDGSRGRITAHRARPAALRDGQPDQQDRRPPEADRGGVRERPGGRRAEPPPVQAGDRGHLPERPDQGPDPVAH